VNAPQEPLLLDNKAGRLSRGDRRFSCGFERFDGDEGEVFRGEDLTDGKGSGAREVRKREKSR
jgi:hypothetical protein